MSYRLPSQLRSATGPGRQGVRPLLRQVGGKVHATPNDHEETPEPPRKKLKSPPSINASPKSSSDSLRNPDSSGAEDNDFPVSSADIPSSYEARTRSKEFRGPAPQRSRPRNLGLDGSIDKSPRILLRKPPPLVAQENDEPAKPSRHKLKVPPLLAPKADLQGSLPNDDENLDVFGEVKRKTGKKKTLRIFGKITANKTSTSASESRPKSSAPVFKTVPQLEIPSSSNKTAMSLVEGEEAYAGAEHHVDELQGDTSHPQSRRMGTKKKSSSQATEASSQEGPKFKEVFSLTQAISKLDKDEIEKDRKKHERLEKEEADLAARLPDEGPCPMQCGKTLPRHVLDTLSENAGVREQQRFCRKHQIKDAEQERDRQEWPNPDWSSFLDRLEEHEHILCRMFEKPERLHFRKAMAERIRTGSRNLRQQMEKEGFEGFGVGYYGLKGHDMMTSYISKNFAAQLEKHTKTDTLMSAQGAMAYVQEVLVPELATVLIKEDKNVNEREARRIMKESTWVGDLLCPSEAGGRKRRRLSSDDYV